MKIQVATREKLVKIANKMIDKWGYEVVNVSNFTQLVKEAAEDLDLQISRLTIRNYAGYLSVIIRNKEKEKKDIFMSPIKEDQVESEDSILKNVDNLLNEKKKAIKAIVVVYEDNSKEIVWGEIKKKTEEEPILWIGLFDYCKDGRIIVKKDKRYIGCDITDPQSVIEYYKSMDNFIEWCEWSIRVTKEPGFRWNADTEKNIETLKSILSEIEKRKVSKFI